MTETELVKSVLQFLAYRGHFAWRNNTGARPWTDRTGKKRIMKFGAVGSPDIIGIHKHDGKLIAIECKVGKRELTREQGEFLERIKLSGGYAFEVRDVKDLEHAL